MTEPSNIPRTSAILNAMLGEIEPVRYNPEKCVDLIVRKLGTFAGELERELAEKAETIAAKDRCIAELAHERDNAMTRADELEGGMQQIGELCGVMNIDGMIVADMVDMVREKVTPGQALLRNPQPLKPNDIDGPLYRMIRAVAASRVMFPARDSFAAPAPFDLKVADLEAVIERMVSWWDAQEGHSQDSGNGGA